MPRPIGTRRGSCSTTSSGRRSSRPEKEKVLRQRLPLMFIALSALWALAAHAEDRIPLKSVNVEIPFGDRMFEGPGSDVANNNCLACHSAGMVLDQPALSQAQWRAEVEKMLTAYKAPVDPKDVDAIVAYLVSIKGAK